MQANVDEYPELRMGGGEGNCWFIIKGRIFPADTYDIEEGGEEELLVYHKGFCQQIGFQLGQTGYIYK